MYGTYLFNFFASVERLTKEKKDLEALNIELARQANELVEENRIWQRQFLLLVKQYDELRERLYGQLEAAEKEVNELRIMVVMAAHQ